MMLTGLDILLARMKTNPEEFLHTSTTVPYEGEMFGGRWSDLLDYAWRVGDDEERKMLQDAKIEFYRDDFNERVMKRLAGEEEPPRVEIDLALRASQRQKMAQQQQMMQNSMAQNAVLQGGIYNPNTHGYLTTTGTGGFQAAEIKQEGATIGYSGGQPTFWSGLFGGQEGATIGYSGGQPTFWSGLFGGKK
jgi:hypothetical protein